MSQHDIDCWTDILCETAFRRMYTILKLPSLTASSPCIAINSTCFNQRHSPLHCEGRSKGFAHVDFSSQDLASRAVTELNGMELMGRSLRIDYAQRKEDRPAGQEYVREAREVRALRHLTNQPLSISRPISRDVAYHMLPYRREPPEQAPWSTPSSLATWPGT